MDNYNTELDYLLSVLDNSLFKAQELLATFSFDADFNQKVKLTFGENVDGGKAESLLQEFLKQDSPYLPKIEIRDESEINGANGAFAGETHTIYIAREFLLENVNNTDQIAAVLLEELGHALDFQVNSVDTIGDEGELFSNLVRGVELSEGELQRIKTEDDSAIATIDGQTFQIEQSNQTIGLVEGTITRSDSVNVYDYGDNWTFQISTTGGNNNYVSVTSNSNLIYDLVLEITDPYGYTYISDDYTDYEEISLAGAGAGTYTATVYDKYYGLYAGHDELFSDYFWNGFYYEYYEYYVWVPDDVSYTLEINAPLPLATDLIPYQPDGWDGEIVISTVTGTNTDAATITTDDSIYLDFANINQGDAATGDVFNTRLLLNGTELGVWFVDPPLEPNDSRFLEDYLLPSLSAGTYTLTLEVDYQNAIAESDESNNIYEKTFTVESITQPDLIPYQPIGWDGEIVISTVTDTNTDTAIITTDDTIYLDWAAINQGDAATGDVFNTRLLLNGTELGSWFSNPPLEPNDWTFVEDYLLSPLSAGTYTLTLEVDYQNAIAESDESNNIYEKTFTVDVNEPPTGDIYEPNNSLATATILQPAFSDPDELYSYYEKYGLTIEPQGDQDWFQIDVDETGDLYAEIDLGLSGNLDLELYDSQGNLLNGSYSVSNLESVFAFVTPGTYYLSVYGYAENTNNYDLFILAPSSNSQDLEDDQFEENDNFSTARDFGVVNGILTESNLVIKSDDDDWYHFTLNAPGVAGNEVAITFENSSGDLDLQLYNSNQNLINGSYSVSNSESINLLALVEGDYYVRVYGYAGSSNPNYTLTIDAPTIDNILQDDQYEDNDTQNTATDADLIPGFNINNGILTVENLVILANDDDWFRFQLGTPVAGSEVSITFEHSFGDLDLQLYNSNQNLINGSYSIDNYESISLLGLTSGEYYIRVYGFAEAQNPNYTLNINAPITVEQNDDRFEANDTFATATPLGNQSKNENGLIILSDNPDYFQFELTDTGTATSEIIITFANALGDLDLEIYDAEENIISGSYGISDYERISLTNLSAGTYYALVSGFNHASNPSYELSLTLPSDSDTNTIADDDFEENDNFASATDLRSLQSTNTFPDLVIRSGDDDWYKFELLANGDSGNYLSVDFLHGLGDLDIRLFDAENNYLNGSFSVTNRETISLAGLASGQYYLQVYGYNNAQNPNYSLTINAPSVGSINIGDDGEITSDILADAYEVNDEKNQASLIREAGVIENLTIHAADDQDWFKFTLAEDGDIADRIRIDFNHGQGDIDIELFDSENLFPIRQSQSLTNNEVLSLEGLIAGTYFAKVYGFEGATNPNYTFSISGNLDSGVTEPISIDDRFEENDFQPDAAYDFGLVRSLEEPNLVITPFDDDWYKFTTTDSGRVEVEIAFDHNLGDLDLLVIDPNNIEFRSQGVTDGEGILIPNATPGEFLIQVYGYDSGEGPATNPNYSLSITAPSTTNNLSADDLEVNDTAANATVIRENSFSVQNLTIHNPTDQDWFKFTTQAVGSQGNQILIQYEKTQGELDLILLDESGNPLSNYGSNFTDNPSGIDTEVISLGELPQGTYYAQVAGVNNATNPGYSLSFNAPVQEIINTTTPDATWTILVYIAGDNNLDAAALKDINEMESVDLPSNVNVVVQVDRSAEHNVLGEGDWHDTRRGVIRRDYDFNTVTSPLESIGEKNMGSAETLKEFIQWGTENYEAQNYAVVLWNHGGGLPGVAWDEDPEANNDNLTVAEVTQAITDSGVQFRLVGFDACLQGLIEQGYDLKDVTDYVVHSQDLEPGDGWDYEGLLQQLASNPNMTPEQLAGAIVETYGDFYDSNQTQSAVDASHYEELALTINTFANTVLTQATDNDWNRITQAVYAAPFYYDRSYRDLGVFMGKVQQGVTNSEIATAAGVVKDAVRNAVISNIDVRDASGISVYLPPANSSVISSYSQENFSFLADTAWSDFLAGYTNRRNVQSQDRVLPDFAEATERTGRSTVRTNNDTRSQSFDLGRLVESGNIYQNLTIDSGDIDWYRFEIATPGSNDQNVQITFEHALGDLKLGLYDSNGTLFNESNTSDNDNGKEEINLNGLERGEYFIKVEGVDGAVSPDYQLVVNVPTRTGPTATIEPDWAGRNDTPEQATQLGSISYGEQIKLVGLNIDNSETTAGDWFVYQPSRITDLNPNAVNINFEHSQGDLDLYVYEKLPGGELSLLGSSTSSNNEEYFSFGETNNLVYIHVMGKNNATNPNYELRIARRQLDIDGNGRVTNEDYQLAFFADPTVFGTSPSQLQQRIDDLELTTENSARKTATEIIEFLQRFFPAADSRNFGGTQGNIVSRSNTTNMGQVFIGNDQLHEFTGSNKDDTFYSGTGDELLTGGGGSNTFVFGINNGNDTITDFKVSQDIIRIVNDSSLGFTNTSDIVDSLTRESDSLSQLSLGSGFLNINHDQPLSASNFVLV